MLSKSKLEKSTRSTAERREEKYREVMTKEFAPASATQLQQTVPQLPEAGGQGAKLDAISTMMELPIDKLRPASWAAAKLFSDAKERFDDPQVFTLTMHIRVDGKVELIPVPQRKNIEKMQEHFDKLPKQLQRTLKNSMPKDHQEALREICDYLDACRVDASDKKHPKPENGVK